MRFSKMIGATAFCFSIMGSILYSQVRIEGEVTDNGGQYLGNGAEPVEGVRVEVTDQSDPTRRFSGVTDSGGKYSIEITGTGIRDGHSGIPGIFGLSQNYPNPFNPSTLIAYELVCPADIRIEVRDLLGRRIRTLLSGFRSEGPSWVVWNATDEYGRSVPAGVYVYSLTVNGAGISRKMLLIDGGASTVHGRFSKRDTSPRMPERVLSDRYRIHFSGMDIETHEQEDVQISGPTVLDVTVNRTVTDIDGNVYRTVKIDGQWWTAENLKTIHYRKGLRIPNITEASEWGSLTTGACCDYDNNTDYDSTYGRLYNWYAVSDSRNIAPPGWHVPTDAEWQTLVDFMGGSSVAGGKMKEAGTSHWSAPNTGATNESCFSALPGGCRYYDGTFRHMGYGVYFWSSSGIDALGARYQSLYYDGSDAYRGSSSKQNGFSVRLVRD
jgi:uncharacterized protein (TIGR02145 family)